MADQETHYGMGDRGQENLRRLQIYDRLGAQQDRNSAAQTKLQFEQAFKESEQQRKIAATGERLKIAQEHNDLLKQQREVQQSLADARIESLKAEMALAQHKAESTAEVARQTTGLFTDLEAARDPKGFVSPSALAKLRAQYPDAAMHANNASALEHELRRFDEAAKLQAQVPKTVPVSPGTTVTTTKNADGTTTRVSIPNKSTQDALLSQHAILEGQLMKTSGQSAPDPALVGQINAVKQQLGYQLLDPKTGAVVATPPAPAAPVASPGAVPSVTIPATPQENQTAGATLAALGTPAPIATAPAPAVTATVTIPDAAVAHLKANPHLATDFDAKFGTGASDKILSGGQ